MLALTGIAHAQSNAGLADVFNGDMLYTNLRYFESIAGIARESWGDEHIYIVDGCQVTVEAPGDHINSLSLDINDNCKIGLESFIGELFAPDNLRPWTFGNFADHAGQLHFSADCLTNCGNAYDPSVHAYWEGSHAVNFIKMRLDSMLVDDKAIEAAHQWADLMRQQHGEDYVMDTAFNCESAYDETASRLFRGVNITRITLGNMTEECCE